MEFFLFIIYLDFLENSEATMHNERVKKSESETTWQAPEQKERHVATGN